MEEMDKKKLNIPIYPLEKDKRLESRDKDRKLLEGSVQEAAEKLMFLENHRQELNIIDDIIDIYNGKCKNYEDYKRKVRKRKHYLFVRIMSPDLYEYIIAKGKKDGNIKI